MRGILLKELAKGPDDLTVSDLPDAVPKPEEYLIEIHASATNFYDTLQIVGKYQHQPKLPWVAGSEFSGVVLKAPTTLPGGRTPKYKAGDKVFGASQGGYASKIAAKETSLLPVPKGWTFFDAAGLFVTAPTSYGALVNRAGIKSGDFVLVHAAAGGVGLAAVQIAKAFGATVIATAGTKHKMEVARSYGADFAIDYRQPNWPDEVKKLTPKGRGVDIVYDPVGMIAQSMKCTAWNGRLLVIGFAAGDIEKIATNRILLKNISVVGVNGAEPALLTDSNRPNSSSQLHWGAYATNEPEMVPRVWQGIFDLIAAGKFRGTCFTDEDFSGLERVPAALKALASRGTWGKVVVRVSETAKKEGCGSAVTASSKL